MKNIISFFSYHNAVPAGLIVLALGAGSAFAASATGILPLSIAPAQSAEPLPPLEPVEVDASALLFADVDAFDFRPTVTGVVETDTLYTVSYSIDTLAPEGSAWVAYEKTGEFSVAKDALGEGGLNAYVVGKLRDIENGERLYLTRAQTAEKALADARQARPSSAFAALVGLALDQIFVPVVEKPAAPEPQPQMPPTQSIPTPVETSVVAPPAEEDTTTNTDAINSATSTPAQSPESTAGTPESAATSTEQTSPLTNEDANTPTAPQPPESVDTETTPTSETEADTAQPTEQQADTTQPTDPSPAPDQTQEPAPSQ